MDHGTLGLDYNFFKTYDTFIESTIDGCSKIHTDTNIIHDQGLVPDHGESYAIGFRRNLKNEIISVQIGCGAQGRTINHYICTNKGLTRFFAGDFTRKFSSSSSKCELDCQYKTDEDTNPISGSQFHSRLLINTIVPGYYGLFNQNQLHHRMEGWAFHLIEVHT